MDNGNWIVDNLNSALNVWNTKLAEIWVLLTQSPETFKGGGVWEVMLNINGALKAIGYGLLVLFFAVGIVKMWHLCGGETARAEAFYPFCDCQNACRLRA